MPTSGFSAFSKRRNIRVRNRGFSLIEVLVVIAIISVLATILLGYSRNNSRQIFLTSLISKTEALIANARASSIQTFFNNPSDVICAHGVQFDVNAQKAYIFQFIEESGNCPDEARIDDYREDPSKFKRLDGSSNQVSFESNQFSVELGESSFYMIFVPPDPVTIFEDSTAESETLNIQVDNLRGSVTMTKYGQVDAQYFE